MDFWGVMQVLTDLQGALVLLGKRDTLNLSMAIKFEHFNLLKWPCL